MDFFAFDKAYVERLRNCDPATEHHFFVYFEKLLHIKLRRLTGVLPVAAEEPADG